MPLQFGEGSSRSEREEQQRVYRWLAESNPQSVRPPSAPIMGRIVRWFRDLLRPREVLITKLDRREPPKGQPLTPAEWAFGILAGLLVVAALAFTVWIYIRDH